jgi:lipid II:glycine glycyltransferase (peptidoglycan interpeptide bridge formation enzyme)
MYTLIVDLSRDLNIIEESFDKVLRKNINGTLKEGVSVEEGSMEDLDFLHSSIGRRLKEQGESSINKSFLYDISKSFFPQNLKIFIARYKGEKVGGLIITLHHDKASALFGTSKIAIKGIYPNDLIHWEAIKWAKENGFGHYEIMDTGEFQRLCTYKSQFNPTLSVWFSATKYSSSFVRLAQKSYTLLRKKLTL